MAACPSIFARRQLRGADPQGSATMQLVRRSCGFHFRRAREAFDLFLVIGIEAAGMPVAKLIEEPGALLRLLAEHMAKHRSWA